MAIFDDFQQIAPLAGGEAIGAPIVEDEEIDPDQRPEQPREPAVAVREFEIGEQARHAVRSGRCSRRGRPCAPSAQASQTFAHAAQAYDILPRNICSKLSFNIRIIRALVSASWF